ncbi:MAG: NAD(P)H-hydrate epimerase [Anaerohalosphaera sp.]|nr:NAD(P)H-hydrate epimerase [Anaerohalosphaera sp.]
MKNDTKSTMSRAKVRQFDAWAIKEIQIPSVVLMENAGKNCTAVIYDILKISNANRVTIIAGTGNNGGDGYVVARHLFNLSIDVKVLICGDEQKIGGDAKTNLTILRNMKIPVTSIDLNSSVCEKIIEHSLGSNLIIDAIFGTGLSGPCREPYPAIIQCINGLGIPIVAVDIPSGLDCDLGRPTDGTNAIKALTTVTFAAMKQGFEYPGAEEYTGKVITSSIGIEPTP